MSILDQNLDASDATCTDLQIITSRKKDMTNHYRTTLRTQSHLNLEVTIKKLFVTRCNIDIRKFSYSRTTVKPGNRLYEEIMNVKYICDFENKLDEW